MSLTKSWYTIDEAASKFGLSKEQINKWIDSGLVRTEERKNEMTLINGDDIAQELHLIPSV